MEKKYSLSHSPETEVKDPFDWSVEGRNLKKYILSNNRNKLKSEDVVLMTQLLYPGKGFRLQNEYFPTTLLTNAHLIEDETISDETAVAYRDMMVSDNFFFVMVAREEHDRVVDVLNVLSVGDDNNAK